MSTVRKPARDRGKETILQGAVKKSHPKSVSSCPRNYQRCTNLGMEVRGNAGIGEHRCGNRMWKAVARTLVLKMSNHDTGLVDSFSGCV